MPWGGAMGGALRALGRASVPHLMLLALGCSIVHPAGANQGHETDFNAPSAIRVTTAPAVDWIDGMFVGMGSGESRYWRRAGSEESCVGCILFAYELGDGSWNWALGDTTNRTLANPRAWIASDDYLSEYTHPTDLPRHLEWKVWDGYKSQFIERVRFVFESRTPVVCGAVIKLQHTQDKYRLHGSPNMRYRQSGHKLVTGFGDYTVVHFTGGSEVANSYWIVRPALGAPSWTAPTCNGEGGLVTQGMVVRLQHLASGMWLHTGWHAGHMFPSPMTRQQEVALAGGDYDLASQPASRESDYGDNWELELLGRNGLPDRGAGGVPAHWEKEGHFRLRHHSTKKFLGMTTHQYSSGNGEMANQMEVVATDLRQSTVWMAADGVYVAPTMSEKVEDPLFNAAPPDVDFFHYTSKEAL